jgi:hypothetical protein
MATVILVKGTVPIAVGTLVPEIRKVLRLILGLTMNPSLAAVDRYGVEPLLEGTHRIEPGKKEEVIGIKSLDDRATVDVTTQNIIETICISPDTWRTDLEYAIAAAVAAAIAGLSEAEVQDPALTYTTVFSQPAKKFVEAIKVNRSFDNINEAARAFFPRLPGVGQGNR